MHIPAGRWALWATWQLTFFLLATPAGAVPRGLDLLGTPAPPWGTVLADVAVSPDSAYLYATSGGTNGGLTVFRQDAGTGRIVFVTVHRNGALGYGLDSSGALAVSPDGAHLYVAGTSGGVPALGVFARNAGTGDVAPVEVQLQGVGGVDGLAGLTGVAVSPDGAHVYVSAVSGSVAVFARNAGTGQLTFVEVQQNGIGGVTDLVGAQQPVVSPDGGHVYVASSTSDSVVAFSRNAGTGQLTFVEAERDGSGGVDGLDGALGVVVSPDGASVYVAGFGDNAVAAFARNAGTGQLTFVEVERSSSMTEPTGLTISPDGGHVYAVSSFGMVGAYARNVSTGALTVVQFDGSNTNSQPVGGIVATPDGSRVYVQGRIAVALLTRDGGTGALTYVATTGAGSGSGVALSPDAAHLYSGTSTYSRDPGTGLLSFVDTFSGYGYTFTSALAISPDGGHVYVGSSTSDRLAAFSRDAGTGLLTFVEGHQDGVGGLDGLDGVSGVAISGDGSHVYVSSDTDDAVVVFSRNAGTGQLTFVERERDGVAGVDGLDGASAIVLSPDGTHAYVASREDAAVAIFARNAGTGHLTFIGAEHDGLAWNPSEGEGRALEVAVSADGTSVYVGGIWTLAGFDRDAGTGALTLVQVRRKSENVVENLFGEVSSIALSADGSLVYVGTAGSVIPIGGPGVVIFSRDTGTGVLAAVTKEFQGGGGVAVTGDGAHVYSAAVAFAPAFTGCAPTPAAGCHGGNGRVTLGGSRQVVSWSWTERGTPFNLAEFGDPATTTHYALCVYQSSANLALRALAPARGRCRYSKSQLDPCWKPHSTTKIVYTDRYRAPEGIQSVRLPSPTAAHPVKIAVSGKGEHAGLPTFPLALPVRVQLQASNGGCWESTYTTARSNTPLEFRARTD